jgi:hypothetical protein
MMGPTWENGLYQLTATTQLIDNCDYPTGNAPRPVTIPTAIFDRVRAAGLTAGYYHHRDPITGLFDSRRYDDVAHPIERFWEDAARARSRTSSSSTRTTAISPKTRGSRTTTIRGATCWWRKASSPTCTMPEGEPPVGPPGLRAQLRRARRFAMGALCTAQDRARRAVRALLDLENDRVALGP